MSKIANLILLVGFLVALGSAFMWFGNRKTSANSSKLVEGGPLVERNAAIEKAKSEGKSEYSFKTNFIPGIGNAPPAEATPEK